MARNYKQGFFKPVNESKYKGNVDAIVYRSGWELNAFTAWDRNDNVLRWSSEEVIVPYRSPVDGQMHRYFIDAWIQYKTKSGEVKETLIEIKPYEQTQPPKKQKRITQQYKDKVFTYLVNQAKWKAAKRFAQKRGIDFGILTEKGMFII